MEEEDSTVNVLGIVSIVTGVLAVIGHCCCCIPLVSTIAPFIVLPLELIAFVTGGVGFYQARTKEVQNPLPMVGLVFSVVAVLLSIVYMVFFGAAIFAYFAVLFGAVVSTAG